MTNPRSGTEWEVIEMEETRFVLRNTIPEGVSRPEVAEHYALAGARRSRCTRSKANTGSTGSTVRSLPARRSIFPTGVKHVHPYSDGTKRMVIDQLGIVPHPAPNAVRDTFGFFFTMFDWEAAGKIKLDRIGLPRHPMQFALAGRVLGRAGGYDARMPKALADFGGATFGMLAEKLGYKVIDEKWR